MLSRRHLRIKVLQALYAFTVSLNDRLDLGEKELLRSLDKLYEIYIYQLSLIIEIVNFAKKGLKKTSSNFSLQKTISIPIPGLSIINCMKN